LSRFDDFFKDMCEHIGKDEAISLTRRFAGSEIYIPANPFRRRKNLNRGAYEDLVEYLQSIAGQAKGLKLVHRHVGAQIYFPKLPHYEYGGREGRNKKIREMVAKKVPYSVIAKKFELTERGVWEVIYKSIA
tara:strand:- start:7137 stop:7532 length:396 start_codon:yes stop_codon:yes gene_type:complete